MHGSCMSLARRHHRDSLQNFINYKFSPIPQTTSSTRFPKLKSKERSAPAKQTAEASNYKCNPIPQLKSKEGSAPAKQTTEAINPKFNPNPKNAPLLLNRWRRTLKASSTRFPQLKSKEGSAPAKQTTRAITNSARSPNSSPFLLRI